MSCTQELEIMKTDLKSKRTLTQNNIYSICISLFKELPSVLNKLNIEYIEYPNRYSFACPIHNGDNPEGCSIFTDGHSSKGNWQCWTHHCEGEYTNNIFGFIRGILSTRRNRNISLQETEKFCLHILENGIQNEDRNDNSFDIYSVFTRRPEIDKINLDRDKIRSRLEIPAQYFINRGFSAEILDQFDIGFCAEKNRPMYNRAVAPIYDMDSNYIGCVGRAVDNETKPKWLHSKGFKKAVLYGLNIAKSKILDTQSIILVEGQGDVWRMHEAGFTQTVGIFGSSLSDDQLLLLELSGALNLIILTDSDDAGEKASNQIIRKCGRRFNYYRPTITKKDVGEMPVDQIKEELLPQLEGVV